MLGVVLILKIAAARLEIELAAVAVVHENPIALLGRGAVLVPLFQGFPVKIVFTCRPSPNEIHHNMRVPLFPCGCHDYFFRISFPQVQHRLLLREPRGLHNSVKKLISELSAVGGTQLRNQLLDACGVHEVRPVGLLENHLAITAGSALPTPLRDLHQQYSPSTAVELHQLNLWEMCCGDSVPTIDDDHLQAVLFSPPTAIVPAAYFSSSFHVFLQRVPLFPCGCHDYFFRISFPQVQHRLLLREPRGLHKRQEADFGAEWKAPARLGELLQSVRSEFRQVSGSRRKHPPPAKLSGER